MNNKRKGYSVKQGRMRSAQGVAGGIFGILFGIIWTVAAIGIGAPWFFALFGVIFVGSIAFNTYISWKNATGENRYSEFDIVEMNSEPDPWDERFRSDDTEYEVKESCGHIHEKGTSASFCPYCGTEAETDFEFCKKCGRKLPD